MAQAPFEEMAYSHLMTIKDRPTEKPRANVEPFVHSVQPSHGVYANKDRQTTSPTYHSSGTAVIPSNRIKVYHQGTSLQTLEAQPLKPYVGTSSQPLEALSREPHTLQTAQLNQHTSPIRQQYPATSTPIRTHPDHTHKTRLTEGTPSFLFPPLDDSKIFNSSDVLCQNCSVLEQKVKFLTEANRELKRLLIASLGADLKHQMEQIINEKAVITCDLDLSLKQLAENLEIVDKVSIDCDVWRSKFFASRLMIDELASMKREMSQHLTESQRALECMLKERDRLCEVLNNCNDKLRTMIISPVPHTRLANGTVLDVAGSFAQLLAAHTEEHTVKGGRIVASTSLRTAPELTMGEKLARKVLSSRERELQLPPKLKEGEISRHQLNHHLLLTASSPDFHCRGCQGPLINV